MERCSTCGASVPQGARFCQNCGAPVAGASEERERKVATMVFADLVGSTKLAGDLDPERTRALLERPALGWPMAMPIIRRLLARDLDSSVPSLIHVQHRCLLPLARWLSSRWKCPVVLSVHDYLNQGETLHCDQSFPSAVVAVSESVREELLSRLCRADSQPLSALAGAAGSADSAAPAVFFCPPLVRVFLSAG